MQGQRQKYTLAVLVVIAWLVTATSVRAEPVSVEASRVAAGNYLSGWPYGKSAGLHERASDTVAVRGRDGKPLAYVHRMVAEGYVITSADTDVKPVLGYSLTGHFPFNESGQNVQLHVLKWDAKRGLAVAGDMSEECRAVVAKNRKEWERLSSTKYGFSRALSDDRQWGPWIETDWDQGGRYNDFCPYKSTFWKLSRRPVGCTATSLAQIVYYWEWPSSISFSSADFPTGDGYRKNGIDFDASASTYGFPTASELDSALDVISFDDDDDEVAYLCFGLGVKVRMFYGVNGSGAGFHDVHRALLTELSYGSASLAYDDGVGIWSDIRAEVIRNMKDGLPVQIAIRDPDPDPDDIKRHSVIVDGYRESDGYFHVNWGWGNSTSTWYDLPEGHGGYEIVYMVLHDVSPSKGWGQDRADAKNSGRVRIGAPAAATTKKKWVAECSTSYSFAGIVLGTGGRTWASCNPNVRNDDNPSYLWEIDWDGKVLNKFEFEDEDHGLGYPAQNSLNEVFVATPRGTVYRVDPETKKIDLIRTISGKKIELPLKIDEDDRIYLTTTDALYCINRTGTLLWSSPFTPRKSGKIYHMPAIDTANGRVFVAYTDLSAQISYLSVLDTKTGKETDYREWWNVNKFSKWIKTPVVDSEGIVFLSVLGAVYAVDPDDELDTVAAWDCPGSTPNPVAIGRDGRIYISYWEDKGGKWYRTVGAFDMDDKSGEFDEAWVERFEEEDDYDNIRAPYFAANDVILFTHTLENGSASDTHTLYAYRDNGTSATKLWDYDLDESGGEFALAPEAVVITIPTSGHGHSITALTEPDRLGMGWSKNGRPGTAANTSIQDGGEIDSAEVTLSWTCSDPDDHDLTYDVFFGEADQVRAPVAVGLTKTSFKVTGLERGTSYIWRVISSDGQSVTPGEAWEFSTKPNTLPEITTDASASPATVEIETDVSFTVTAVDADDDPLTYSWEFGDGHTAVGRTVTHDYADIDEYTATVRIGDGIDVVTQTVTVTVVNSPPEITTAVAASPPIVEIGKAVGFSVSATDVNGDTLTYSWEFGDGHTAVGSAVTHAYADAGEPTATVSVSDGTDVVTRRVTLTVAETLLPGKIKGYIRFRSQEKNSLKVKGKLTLPEDFTPTGKSFRIEVGGVGVTLALDHKGKAKGNNAKVKLKYRKKKGLWEFEATVKRRSWLPMQPFGIAEVLTDGKVFVTLPIWLTIDGVHFIKSVDCSYKTKKHKGEPRSGKFKSLR